MLKVYDDDILKCLKNKVTSLWCKEKKYQQKNNTFYNENVKIVYQIYTSKTASCSSIGIYLSKFHVLKT